MFNQGIYSKSSGGGGTGQGITGVVANYSALPSAASAADEFYFVESSQGTAWLPGSLGGTYYPAGLYYSNGVTWFYAESPYQATLATVNTGTNTDQFVSPYTFTNADKWGTKSDKLITTNRQVASYQLVLADADKLVEMNVGSANNLTVPENSTIAFSIGTQILISQYGAGQTSVVAAGSVSIRSAGGALKLAAQYSGATLIKIATDEWYLFGDITV